VFLTGSLSACVSSPSEPTQVPAENQSWISVDNGEGGQVTAKVTNSTGTLVGHVLTDAGFGLPEARVTVWGAPEGASTNGTGWFQVVDIPPGKRQVRAEHPNYFPAESEVEIVAANVTRVTVTLVPSEAAAGYRPHVHDYWAGRSEVTVIDRDFEFHPPSGGLTGTTDQLRSKAMQAYQSRCVSGDRDQYPSSGLSQFHFDDPGQLVYPGTGEIKVRITWNPTDYVGARTVAIVWHSANLQNWTWTHGLQSGQSLLIPVTPEMADPGHHPFSLWEFRLCLTGKDEYNQYVYNLYLAWQARYLD